MALKFDNQRDTISASSGFIRIDNTGALQIPVGNELQRPSPQVGSIRFNSDISEFEGYDGTEWSNLGGLGDSINLVGKVIDTDGNTYIIAETGPNVDNNQLDFYTDGVQRLQIDSNGEFKFGYNLNRFVIDWATGDTAIVGELAVGGDITIGGNINLGENGIGGVSINADLTSNLIPNVPDTYDIGSAAKAWQDIYLSDTLNFVGASGENQIVVPANMQSAIKVTDGVTDYVEFDTTTGLEKVNVKTDFQVDGQSSFSTLQVSSLTAGRVVLAGTNGLLQDNTNLKFENDTLGVGDDVTVESSLGRVKANLFEGIMDGGFY